MNCKTIDNCASVCIKCACGVHMWCMCKVWQSTFRSKCVKQTTNDQNMINKSNQGNPQSLELIGVQNNTKMPFEHFLKHLICTYTPNMWAMHEHEWKLPKYMLKCHNWPTQPQTNQMEQNPIKKLKKISQKIEFPTLFQNNPIQVKP